MRELIAKNNANILRRIYDKIRILEPYEKSKVYDEAFNQKIKK